MKRLNNILAVLISLLILLVFMMACTPEEDLAEREAFIQSITGAWEITEESSIVLNDQDITHAFTGFQITIAADLTFITNSDELQIEEFPWSSTGVFELNDELNLLTRDDGLEISLLLSDDGTTLELEFTADETTGGGRIDGVRGGWKLILTKRG